MTSVLYASCHCQRFLRARYGWTRKALASHAAAFGIFDCPLPAVSLHSPVQNAFLQSASERLRQRAQLESCRGISRHSYSDNTRSRAVCHAIPDRAGIGASHGLQKSKTMPRISAKGRLKPSVAVGFSRLSGNYACRKRSSWQNCQKGNVKWEIPVYYYPMLTIHLGQLLTRGAGGGDLDETVD